MSRRLSSQTQNNLRAEFYQLKGDRDKVLVGEIETFARNNPDSDWHGILEWNNEVAGQQHRYWQIRCTLAVLQLQHDIAEGNGAGMRELVSLSIDRVAGGGYRTLQEVMDEPALAEVYLADALKELERIRDKYQHIQQLSAVWAAIGRAARAAGRAPGQRAGRGQRQPPPPPSRPPRRGRRGQRTVAARRTRRGRSDEARV